MPSDLTFWTGVWEPGREALSNEVAALRTRFAPRAPVVSFAAGQRYSFSARKREVRLRGGRIELLWALARVLEPCTRLNHILGPIGAWHQLRVLGRRPILMTAMIETPALPGGLYDKVSCFVAESRRIADVLIGAGVPASRLEVIYPGVDLSRFRPAARGARPVRILFASSPASPDELDRRGIPLIIEAARRCPEIELVLLWRRWGRVDLCVRALERAGLPPNVHVEVRDVADMAAVYQTVDATVFLPPPGHGKSAPNSVIEGLASGCAAIVHESCGIADLVRAGGAGVVLEDLEPAAVADAMRTVAVRDAELSRHARTLAERSFSEQQFFDGYAELYGRLLRQPMRSTANPLEPQTALKR